MVRHHGELASLYWSASVASPDEHDQAESVHSALIDALVHADADRARTVAIKNIEGCAARLIALRQDMLVS